MPRGPKIVGRDDGTKTGGKHDAAVTGIAGEFALAGNTRCAGNGNQYGQPNSSMHALPPPVFHMNFVTGFGVRNEPINVRLERSTCRLSPSFGTSWNLNSPRRSGFAEVRCLPLTSK